MVDPLYALAGGAAARKRQKRRMKTKASVGKNKARRAAYAVRCARFEKEERRKSRVAAVERKERAAWCKARVAQGYTIGLPFKDLTGRRFGRLKVLRPGGNAKHRDKLWWVRCICGSPEKQVRGTNLKQGILRSCGCLVREANQRNGMRRKTATAARLRRQVRSDILRWKKYFSKSSGDERLLKVLNAFVNWADALPSKSKRQGRQ
jgi:hypothetical protein